MLSQNKLKELLTYDKLTGVFTWRFSQNNNVVAGRVAGCVYPRGYIIIRIEGKNYLAHRLAWLYTFGYFPESHIDHIDRNTGNNRIDNLREVSPVCNARNTGNLSTNTSGVKGVCWHKTIGRWVVSIRFDGKRLNIGSSKDFTEAVAQRLFAEQCIEWGDCDVQSPASEHIKEYLYSKKIGG